MRTFIAFFINSKTARLRALDESYHSVISASSKAVALKRAAGKVTDFVYRGTDGALHSIYWQVAVEELTYARAKKIFKMYKTYFNAIEASDWAWNMFREAANMLTDDDAIRLSDGEFSR